MKKLTLSTPISDLYMVGKTYAFRLKKLDLETVEDLIHHYPHRYNDFSLIASIASLRPGETATIQGQIVSCKNVYTKTGKKIQKAIVQDKTGQIEVIWFNQPFLTRALKSGTLVSLAGQVDWFGHDLSLVSPEYEILKQEALHTARLVPVYPETAGVSSKWLRSRIAPLIKKLVPRLADWNPEKIKSKYKLIDLRAALKQIHFPKNRKEILAARQRLAFDELFLIQLEARQRKSKWQKTKSSHPLSIKEDAVQNFIKNLPFKLTEAQERTGEEIIADLKREIPMNRLLEGDVGSGKTVVACLAMYLTHLNGLQSALMAPTEILALQHYQTIKSLLAPYKIPVELLTSTRKRKIEEKELKVIIGTHALIYNKVKPENLGLVIIDEQHRFGVEQRAKLISKGKTPHVLTMTATPIPRTIALTMYGDLDLSVIDEMPPGRKQTKTWVVPPHKRKDAYQWIERKIKQEKFQAFIVCPLIEASDKESMKDIRAATAEFNRLKKEIFPTLRLGLLHGRLKTKEKEIIIDKFRGNKIHILVSTPVVEVGIDIPNANIMLVEASERFGLAQLHQLRGRVGRSDKQSYCLLFTSQKNQQSLKRLQAMQQHHSGFQLAEIDLKLRGAGEIYGTKQHGFIALKIASFSDAALIQKTKNAALGISTLINQYPLLKRKIKNYTMKLVEPN